MRFQITRTSSTDARPCDEAVPGRIDRWDVRTFKSPEEHDARLGDRGKWADRGTDHQFVRGPRGGVQGIKRNLGPVDAWFVEFDTLEQLEAFWKKYGDLVLRESWDDKESLAIEIYDDYRE
jgi:hypothetical protein